jgi:CRP-like cAMP-binding protein
MDVVSSLDLADRILALQAVRMFVDVDVADLEQIAETLIEKRYEPDETIFRRGDWEDDMILVVSGEVHLAGDVPIAPRGPGEHIGELAMLRHQPRSLTATAGPEGMHGLVVDCRVLERLVEDRPQIAASMLGTLAEILAAAEASAGQGPQG